MAAAEAAWKSLAATVHVFTYNLRKEDEQGGSF